MKAGTRGSSGAIGGLAWLSLLQRHRKNQSKLDASSQHRHVAAPATLLVKVLSCGSVKTESLRYTTDIRTKDSMAAASLQQQESSELRSRSLRQLMSDEDEGCNYSVCSTDEEHHSCRESFCNSSTDADEDDDNDSTAVVFLPFVEAAVAGFDANPEYLLGASLDDLRHKIVEKKAELGDGVLADKKEFENDDEEEEEEDEDDDVDDDDDDDERQVARRASSCGAATVAKQVLHRGVLMTWRRSASGVLRLLAAQTPAARKQLASMKRRQASMSRRVHAADVILAAVQAQLSQDLAPSTEAVPEFSPSPIVAAEMATPPNVADCEQLEELCLEYLRLVAPDRSIALTFLNAMDPIK